MRSEHLRQWLEEAIQKEAPDATQWLKVVAIVKVEFRNGALADKITWKTMVLGTGWGAGILNGNRMDNWR